MSTLTLETNQNKTEEIDILEDDEFEEFEKEDWNENDEEPEETKEWEEDWDEVFKFLIFNFFQRM
jgi:hypothetical protein